MAEIFRHTLRRFAPPPPGGEYRFLNWHTYSFEQLILYTHVCNLERFPFRWFGFILRCNNVVLLFHRWIFARLKNVLFVSNVIRFLDRDSRSYCRICAGFLIVVLSTNVNELTSKFTQNFPNTKRLRMYSDSHLWKNFRPKNNSFN